MPHKRKRRGGGEAKEAGRKESKRQKTKGQRNFAFCACPNFESCNLASGTKASPALDRLVNNVLDSLDSFWLDSDLKMA